MLFTQYTLQFYNYRRFWYPEGKKSLPRRLKLSPTTVLVWLMDDGSYKGNKVIFHTQSFTHGENKRLAGLLSKIIGIEVRVKSYHLKEYNKIYYFLQITHKLNLRKLINYVKKADQRLFETVKDFYGWKLSPARKKDFFGRLPEERQKKLNLISL